MVSCALDGDSALLDLEKSRYYKLNVVGTHIWQALTEPRTVADLRTIILDAFDVDAERSARDLDALLRSLGDRGLVSIENAQTA